MRQPLKSHFMLVKGILRYNQGTITHGIRLVSHSSLFLYGFSDVDWAECPITRRSTTGYCTYFGGNCISWFSKKQPTFSRSSTKVKYHVMASTTTELAFLLSFLRDLGLYLDQPPTLFCDNISALHLTINLLFSCPYQTY